MGQARIGLVPGSGMGTRSGHRQEGVLPGPGKDTDMRARSRTWRGNAEGPFLIAGRQGAERRAGGTFRVQDNREA